MSEGKGSMSDKDAMLAMVMSNSSASAAEASRVLEKCNWDVEKAMAASSNEERIIPAATSEAKKKALMKKDPTTTKTPYNKSYKFRKQEDEMDFSSSKPNERGRVATLKFTPAAAAAVSSLQQKNDDAYEETDEASYSTAPSLAIADTIQQRASSRAARQASTLQNPRAPVPVSPGAVAVPGPDPSGLIDDEYMVSEPALSCEIPQEPVAMTALSARLVQDHEDVEELQAQVQDLQRTLENVAVAQVITHDDDEKEQGSNGEESEVADGSSSKEGSCIARRCTTRKKWAVGIASALIIVGIVVAVVFSTLPEADPPSLKALLSSVSSDGGAALSSPSTPQNKALNWLAGNANLESYSNEQKIQRYALATLYYSTNGDDWKKNDQWLSDVDECNWYNRAPTECSNDGSLVAMRLYGNNLAGSIPAEIGLCSNLAMLWLNANSLMGTMPSEIVLLTVLDSLRLDDCTLTGTLPQISRMTALEQLDLSNNTLTGTIPSEIGLMSNLEWLSLWNNSFSGEFTCPGFIEQCYISCDSSSNDFCRTL